MAEEAGLTPEDAVTTRSPPDDRITRRWLRKLPDHRAVRAARERGLLREGNELVAGVQLERHSGRLILPLALLGGIPVLPFILFVQRSCLVMVTPSDVIVTRFYRMGRGGPAVDRALRLKRPVHFALADYPLPRQATGQKVRIPAEVAEFLGTDTAWVVLGDLADYVFRIARTPVAVTR